MEILVAEDDRVMRKSLSGLLTAQGYSVRAAVDGLQALAFYRERRPDLLLLDVMMPLLDGYGVCSEVRKDDADTPILFLTALDSDVDELKGLGVGADQHISKTVKDEVLLARIAAALRARNVPPFSCRFRFGEWLVDASRMTMRLSDGSQEVALFDREIALLRLFAARPDEVFSREFLLMRFWGADSSAGDASLTSAIHRLRIKLGRSGSKIRSLRGSGYAYRKDVI